MYDLYFTKSDLWGGPRLYYQFNIPPPVARAPPPPPSHKHTHRHTQRGPRDVQPPAPESSGTRARGGGRGSRGVGRAALVGESDVHAHLKKILIIKNTTQ